MSTKVFMALGAFSRSNELYRKAKLFLDNQREDYESMYNPSRRIFYGERKNGFIDPCYHLDRISNEFSPGVAWAASYYGIDSNAFYNLGAMVRRNNLRSWNGDGFEMGWHLTTFDETQIPQFEIAHHNYLHTMLRISKGDGHPGLRAPGDDPNGGYTISGYDELREGGNSGEDVWNHYTLGAYYRIRQAQSIIDQWYENPGKIQGAVSSMGLFDGGRDTVTTGISFTNTILGIDHLSGIVGQHANGPDYFGAALERIGKEASYIEMYQTYANRNLEGLSRIQAAFATPP